MGPVTLTKPQFLTRRPGGNYGNYLRYVHNARANRPPVAPPSQDPYDQIIAGAPQPYTPAQIQQQLGAFTAGMPAGFTSGQIQQQAQAQISPLIAAVTASIGRQVQSGSQAIKGYTTDLAAKLAAMNFAAPFQQAEGAQANVDAALNQQLTGQGSTDANDLASRLAMINDPSVGDAATAVGANATGAADAQLASGSAALSNLIAQAAAAGSYGQKLPGIAQLTGLQKLGALQNTAAQQIGSQTASIEQQLPAIIQSLASRSDANRANRAQARQQDFQYLSGVNEGRRKDLLALHENKLARNDTIASQNGKNLAAVTVAHENATAKVTAAQLAQANRDRTYRLQLAKTIGYDPVTNKALPGYKWKDGQVGGTIVKTGAAGGQKLPSGKDLNSLVDQWKNGKPTTETAIDKTGAPVTNNAGNPVKVTKPTGQLKYGQAYKRLRAMGYQDAKARQALDSAYKRGEQGRSWLTNEERSALAKAGRQTTVGYYQGHPYIAPQQLAALKAAGHLPPGELVNGRYFIAPVY